MRAEAEKLIADYLRPLVEADGGKIELVEIEGKRVVVRLSGVCSGCPGQPYTLSHVIEPAFRRVLGEEIEVEAVSGR